MNDPSNDPLFDSPDELRRLLSDAVSPVRPAPDALPLLRERVAMRRRQRQTLAMGGTAAAIAGFTLAAVLYGPAGPDPTSGSSAAGPSTIASGEATGGTSQQARRKGTWPGPSAPVVPPAPVSTGKRHYPTAAPSPSPTHEPSKSPTATLTQTPAAVPPCAAADLRKTDKQALVTKVEDAVGYGYLEFENVSTGPCTVTGPQKAQIVDAETGADVGFTSAAPSATETPALADVPERNEPLLLPAKATFRFQFAWTTKATDPATPCIGPESADPARSWAVRFQLDGKGQSLAEVPLPVACKGTFYQTDLYPTGEFAEAFAG